MGQTTSISRFLKFSFFIATLFVFDDEVLLDVFLLTTFLTLVELDFLFAFPHFS